MGKLLNALQVQGFLLFGLICLINAAPYSKYGRSCKDIGCLPREVCVMSYDSCSFGKRENENCGRYPTCKKNTDPAVTQQNSDNSQNFDTDIFNIPTVKVTTTRPTTPRTTTSRVWTTTPRTTTTTRRSYSPSYPSSGGGSSIFGGGSSNTGGSSIFGDFFGGGSSNTGGSGSNTRHGSGGTGGSSPSSGFGSFFGDILGGGGSSPTTRRPSSSGGSSSSGGLFDDFKNILAGQISNVINDALSNRGGFNTRPIQENKGYRGGLFSENPSSGSGHQQSSSNVAPSSQPSGSSTYTRFGQNTYSSQNSFPTLPPTPPTYGWRVPS